MTLEVLGPLGAFLTLITLVTGFYFAGGRKWKGNWEAERESHLLDQRNDSSRIASLESEVAGLRAENEGQGDRLRRLDDIVQELGGQKVYEAMLDMQAKNLALFQEITQAIKEGDSEITVAIRDLSHTLERAANGHGKEKP